MPGLPLLHHNSNSHLQINIDPENDSCLQEGILPIPTLPAGSSCELGDGTYSFVWKCGIIYMPKITWLIIIFPMNSPVLGYILHFQTHPFYTWHLETGRSVATFPASSNLPPECSYLRLFVHWGPQGPSTVASPRRSSRRRSPGRNAALGFY